MGKADWIITFIIVGITICCTFWFLYFNPAFLPYFIIAPIIAVFLLLFLGLCPNCRSKFRKLLSEYAEALGRDGFSYKFYRCGQIFSMVSITLILVLSFIAYYNLGVVSAQCLLYLFVALFIAFLASFIMYIGGFVKITGKWGLLLVLLITAIWMLHYLTSWR